jgi:hypothetical protein
MLLLLGVLGVYYALKLHYVFAFGLVKNTSLSSSKKQKIEKIKTYVFTFLKILLVLGLLAMFVFSFLHLQDGGSLKALVFELWSKVDEGFWTSLLWTVVRIAVLIVLMRYVLAKVFTYLDAQQQKTINKKVYNEPNVKKVYLRIGNTIKYTVVLGVVYRITHFFPFLEEVSAVMLVFLGVFFLLALLVTLREIIIMRGTYET